MHFKVILNDFINVVSEYVIFFRCIFFLIIIIIIIIIVIIIIIIRYFNPSQEVISLQQQPQFNACTQTYLPN